MNSLARLPSEVADRRPVRKSTAAVHCGDRVPDAAPSHWSKELSDRKAGMPLIARALLVNGTMKELFREVRHAAHAAAIMMSADGPALLRRRGSTSVRTTVVGITRSAMIDSSACVPDCATSRATGVNPESRPT